MKYSKVKSYIHVYIFILSEIVLYLIILRYIHWLILAEIRKLLSKIAKDKGNEDLQQWVKPCEKHLYWSATTTSDGNGSVIWAKFKSFLSHIVNKHSGLEDPLFNKCAHDEIPDRKWLDAGTVAMLIIKCFYPQWFTAVQSFIPVLDKIHGNCAKSFKMLWGRHLQYTHFSTSG